MPNTSPIDRRPRTTTSYAILGLLSVRSWTTYELAKQVSRSLNWFWPRAERKIYDEPKVLVAEGLATASRSFTGQRPRTVYDITGAGRDALAGWLDEPPAPRSTEFEAMLKVFFADAGSLAQLLATLDAAQAAAYDRLSELTGMIEAVASDAEFPARVHISALTLRLQFVQEAAVFEWARWARGEVQQWSDTADPGRWDSRDALSALLAEVHDVLDVEAGGK